MKKNTTAGRLAPVLRLEVSPAAAGRQLVRVSLPLPPGFLAAGRTLAVSDGCRELPAGVRVITWHPGGTPRAARRAMVTWVADFADREPVVFTISPREPDKVPPPPTRLPVSWTVAGGEVTFSWEGGPVIRARLLAPEAFPALPSPGGGGPAVEVVEAHGFYRWERFFIPDARFPRLVEIRADALGQVVLVGHVQRDLPGNDYAPELGWALDFRHLSSRLEPADAAMTVTGESDHCFAGGEPCCFHFENPAHVIYHPAAPGRRRGRVSVRRGTAGRTAYRYRRAEAGDRTPFQASAWHRFETVIAPAGAAFLTPALLCPHAVRPEPLAWDALYATGRVSAGPGPELAGDIAFHRELILRCAAAGDDRGNIISWDDNTRTVGDYPMNRLNHCPPIFFEGWHAGDRRLVEAALLWCENFHDLTIWWGPGHTGATRYNHGPALDHYPPPGDPGRFAWRANRAVDFCTKGFDAFFLAWEETGDPLMRRAFEAQAAAAEALLRVDRGECRNIGAVRDFVRLYRYTGRRHFLDSARRLFRELTAKLWPGGLFDQSGKPETAAPPFIDSDADGYQVGYAKAYIIGYALAGLPELLRECPDEPRLREAVQAAADFLADHQDPAGGWRYPHARSSGLGLGRLEHAWQLVQAACVLGPREKYLDAIERALRARLLGWRRTGTVVSGLSGWERAAGLARPLAELYARPEDRDADRDYDQGIVATGGASPEGVVYFPEVLDFYLRHRPSSRLLTVGDDQPLARILRRLPDPGSFQEEGVREGLPVFRRQVLERRRFPLAWPGSGDFESWRARGREKVRECLLEPPPAVPFAPRVLAEERRDGYVARKIAFNLTGDSRVCAYLLVPDGSGPFPAALLLHDHGARFDIGKEKVIAPFAVPPARLASAREWVGRCYGGRFIGDQLARRGFVCLAADMLNWSDRGGGGYEGQQALAANLFHLGMSLAGLIAWEDLRAAEFLAGLPEVDPRRVAALGLSVGAFRTWRLAALSDHVRAGAAICWMATVHGLMVPGNNQTTGQSAFTMVHPGLHRWLDYPDVASLACPKPMLFYNGRRDGLFPVACVEDAYAKMRRAWESQAVGDRLVTRLWDVPHEFSAAMQEAVFAWLQDLMMPGARS